MLSNEMTLQTKQPEQHAATWSLCQSLLMSMTDWNPLGVIILSSRGVCGGR